MHALLGCVELQSGLRGACRGAVLTALNAACLVHSWLPGEGAPYNSAYNAAYNSFEQAKHHVDKEVEGQEGGAVAKTSVQGFKGKLRRGGAREGPRGGGHSMRGPGGIDVGCIKRRGTGARGMRARRRDRVDGDGPKRRCADAPMPDWVNSAWASVAQSAHSASAGTGGVGSWMEGRGVGARLLPLAWLQMR